MTDGNPEGTDQAMATASLLGLLDPEPETPEAEELDEGVEPDMELDEDVEGEEYDEPESRTYTVKVDGQEVEVTEEELLAGYSRQSDYTRKTMELAEHRKQMEAEFQAVQQERQLYAQYLGQLAQANQPQRPNFEQIAQENGLEAAMAAKIRYDEQMERFNALTAEQRATQQRIAEAQARQQQEWQEQEYRELMKARPEWKDPEVYRQVASDIEDFATGLGYTPDQLAQVSHRDILVLDAARKWFAANDKAQKLKPSQGKVIRPGSKGQVKGKSKAAKTAERFKKTGSVDDAAAHLRSILGG